ncbi:MAG: insulinase family protein [Prevotella sp.]|nr:insulinase family protein [Prevotella sp.]
MTMRKLFSAALLLLCMVVQAQPIPVDPDVRKGTLDNGLTYYIRHNNYPEHVASFYIAQKVGSVQENDDQRGLAHLLEHMAFNGTEHFKDNQLQEYLQSIGVEYGRNLNAYTSTDQTVYYIEDVPTARITALDSCMLILKDWSNGITLDEKAIDQERDVVHNEYRMRIKGTQKILENKLPELYPGSKYGERFPIGLMSVIDGCSPETLRAYYRKWYRPDNQGIIIVGDIDVDRTEQKIKELFGGIKVPANAAKVEPVEVPDNNEGIYLVGTDKEQQLSMFLVSLKHDAVPDEMKDQLSYFIVDYARSVITDMLNMRFQEEAQKPESAINQVSASEGMYLVSRTKDAFTLQVMPKEGKDLEALATAIREAKRVKDFGFTATEYDRAKAEILSRVEKAYNNREKTRTSQFCNQYVQNFINHEPIPSIEQEYELLNQLAPVLSVDVINQIAEQFINLTDTNFVALALVQDGKDSYTPADMKKVVEGVRTETLEAYVDNVKQEPLMSEMPAKGSIVSETSNATLGFKQLTLSNGAKVMLKHTDFNADEILLLAVSEGGASLFGKDDALTLQLASIFLSQSAVGNFMVNDLQKALSGKQVSTSFNVQNYRHSFNGSSTPKDLETLMQLTYLSFTNLNKDENAFNNYRNLLVTQLKNISLNSSVVFQDSLMSTVMGGNPLFRIPTAEQVENTSCDRLIEMAHQLYGNAANFNFIFVGNFDEAQLREYIEQYIASLPSTGKADFTGKELRTFVNGSLSNNFTKKMENPQAEAAEVWRSKALKYNQTNNVLADYAGRILDMAYNREIRENMSAAYHAGASCDVDNDGPCSYITIQGTAQLNPEKAAAAIPEFIKGMNATVKAPNEEDMGKVKQILLKQADVDASTNRYWLTVLNRFNTYGVDIHSNYKSIVESVTPKQVSNFLKKVILKSKNHAQVVMMPE